jgi:hypothetical protein
VSLSLVRDLGLENKLEACERLASLERAEPSPFSELVFAASRAEPARSSSRAGQK